MKSINQNAEYCIFCMEPLEVDLPMQYKDPNLVYRFTCLPLSGHASSMTCRACLPKNQFHIFVFL